MKTILVFLLPVYLSVCVELHAATNTTAAPTTPPASPAPPPSASAKLGAAGLEKLLMPIALYSDSLLATLLPASVYPLEIVQAARFVADTNNLAKLDEQPWDESVKALARIPAALKKLNDDLQWTIQLGEAFLNQDKDVMDTIQSLRAKAQQAGTLRTTEQQVVTVTNLVVIQTNVNQVVYVTNQIVQIQPANPQVIYVPTYPYTVYYPPPTYVYDPYAPLITFAAGVAVGAIIWNNCDWHHGGCYHGHYHSDVDIDIDRNVNRNVNRDRASTQPSDTGGRRQKWQPDQSRLNRSGAGGPSASTREARGWGSGSTQASPRPAMGAGAARPSQLPSASAGGARPGQQPSYNWSQRPAAGTQPARTPGAGQVASPAQRPATPSTGARPTTTWQPPSAARPAPSPATAARPAQSQSFNRPSPQASSAFSGINSGGSARDFSNRGSASRGGGGFRGGGGRGGGRR